MSFIAENGSLVVHRGSILSVAGVDADVVRRVTDVVRQAADTGEDLGLVVCGLQSAYIERHDPVFTAEAETYYARLTQVEDLHQITDDFLKLAVYDFADAELSAPIFGPAASDHQVVVSGRHWIDIMAPDVNKGAAVRKLQAALGVTPEQTAAFGDTVGHKSTHVTETVYRHVIRPTIRGGATVMDNVFGDDGDD